ncbi:Las1-domain-containing protein [Phellopilus nigrolimitatus]|nr:Las1-domain-containing protein [Phellopilus nigrolimitatus]
MMRLPRRVPWVSLVELDQVCSWIYTDENDVDATILAINRLSAWRAITPLPHALEATLSLLSSVLLDQQCTAVHLHWRTSDAPTSKNTIALNVRQTYAIAIVRLVNGLVDPLQLGAYARSIASIAAQIGLPQGLVELRHAATHEDLPSLESLRTGAREALVWLLHNYFLPTLSVSVSADRTSPPVQLSLLAPHIKKYKSLLKTITRDASLKTQLKGDLARVLRDVERWVGEAQVASSADVFSGWGAGEQADGDSENERWALERMCEVLLERGGLVPISSKKRLASKLKSLPALPSSLIAIWSPLLFALKANHPSLFNVLVFAITNVLLSKTSMPINDSPQKKDLSYDLCLAAWAAWCVDQQDSDAGMQTEGAVPLREGVVIRLVTALGAQEAEAISESRRGANALLDLLSQTHPYLKDISASLLPIAQSVKRTDQDWIDRDVLVMEERLHTILSSGSTVPAEDSPTVVTEADTHIDALVQSQPEEMPRGWTTVPSGSWRACPIGMYVEC